MYVPLIPSRVQQEMENGPGSILGPRSVVGQKWRFRVQMS